jgi:gamma-glutamyltranspeptidase/glutathione hydrolase
MMKKKLLTVCLVLGMLLGVMKIFAQAPPQAAIASAHPLATEAGKQILLRGGNAFDAAVTITAVLAVVEPYSSGIGGGGFWLLHDQKQKKTIMIDGRETAPAKAHRDMYVDEKGSYIPKSSVDGPLAAGIPGTVAAMVHLSSHYGVLPLEQVLQPAIRLAEKGFPVTAHYQKMVKFRLEVLKKYEDSASIFLHKREVPAIGYTIRQPALANTLRMIASKGHDGFYAGDVANKLVTAVNGEQGIWTLDDLKAYQVRERQPIVFRYRDMTITSAAPPSSGGVALATILQILEHYPLTALDEATQVHLITEAMRLAYRDRAEFLGDSDFYEVPVKQLTDSAHAGKLQQNIQLNRATPSEFLPAVLEKSSLSKPVSLQGEGQDTTHFSILDTQGNRVSATLSINYPFGSGFTARGTGVLLNDEMDDFSASPGTPNVYGLIGAQANAIEPGKRPLSSMSPTFVETKDGVAIIGTPGGSRIITMVLLGILEMEKNRSPQEWVTRARFHHQYLPDKLFFEPEAFNDELIEQLEQLGHELKPLKSGFGNMQVIGWDFERGVEAASDPRVEGKAIVFDVP